MSPDPDYPAARWYRPLYIALVAATIAVVWSWPRVPTQDGPSHAYGLRIVAEMTAGSPAWSEHFALRWVPSPNLGFLAIGLPVAGLAGAERAARLAEPTVVSVYLLIVACGVPFLLRSFGRRALPLSFLSLPLAMNYPFFLGFHAYLVGAALFLPSVGLQWRLRDAGLPARVTVATALTVCLASVHLIAGALTLLSAVLLEVTRGYPRTERPRRARQAAAPAALRAAAVASPSLLVAALYIVARPTETVAGLGARHPPIVLAWMLSHFATVVLDPLQLLPAYAALAWIVLSFPWRGMTGSHGARFLACVAGSVLILYIVLPNFLASGAYLNERLPWLLPPIVLPLLRPWPRWRSPASPRAQSLLLVAIASMWLMLTLVMAGHLAARTDTDVTVPSGTSVAVARFQPRPLWPLHDPWLHTGSMVAARSGALDLAFAHFYMAHFPIEWRHDSWPALDDMHDLYYRPREAADRAWAAAEYVVALDAGVGDRAWLQTRCRPHRDGGLPRAERWPVSVWRDCGSGR